jgi:hypothetical protein
MTAYLEESHAHDIEVVTARFQTDTVVEDEGPTCNGLQSRPAEPATLTFSGPHDGLPGATGG